MKKSFLKRKANQAGQAIVEAVLMMSLLFGAVYFISQEFKSRNFIAQLISGPWLSLAGMIQNGVWGAPSETSAQHAGSPYRRSSVDGRQPD